jgi:galactonate dehydratase
VGGERKTDIGDEARQLVEAGYTAIKMDASAQTRHIEPPRRVDSIVDRITHVRNIVDDDVDIAVDFRGRVSHSLADKLVRALEELDLLFFEEPVLSENAEYYPELARETSTSLAAGERLYSRWDFKELFRHGGVDVIQPDISHAGGISEVMKIAGMAEARDIAIAPNCPLGPIALASSLQVDTTVPNLLVQDHGFDIQPASKSAAQEYLVTESVFEFDDGYVAPLDSPGLGIEIDEDVVKERSQAEINWHNPIWQHEDGSIAEW